MPQVVPMSDFRADIKSVSQYTDEGEAGGRAGSRGHRDVSLRANGRLGLCRRGDRRDYGLDARRLRLSIAASGLSVYWPRCSEARIP